MYFFINIHIDMNIFKKYTHTHTLTCIRVCACMRTVCVCMRSVCVCMRGCARAHMHAGRHARVWMWAGMRTLVCVYYIWKNRTIMDNIIFSSYKKGCITYSMWMHLCKIEVLTFIGIVLDSTYDMSDMVWCAKFLVEIYGKVSYIS